MDNYHQLLQETCYRRFKFYEKSLFILLNLSIILLVLEENYFFDTNFSASLINPYSLAAHFKTTEPESSFIMRKITLILMVIIIVVLYLRKKASFVFMKSISLINFSQQFGRSQSFFEVCIEIGLMCIQTYPNMQGWYESSQRQWQVIYLNDTILTFVALIIRIFFIIRSTLYMTKFSSPKSIKICFDNGISAGILFSLKSEFHNHLKLFVSLFFTLTILSTGILLRLCERSAQLFSNEDWDYVWNSFWCVIITMTTVGYGDFVPKTDNGRVVVGFTALLGSLVTSMICIIFLMEFSFNKNQENAYERIKASECTRKLNESASNCIALAVRYRLNMKKAADKDKARLSDEFFVDIKKKVKDFRTWKKIILDFKHNKKIDRKLVTMNRDFNNNLDELGVLMTYYDFVKMKLELLLKNQKNLDKNFGLMESFHQNFIVQLDRFSQENLKCFTNDVPKTPGENYLKKRQVIGICENMKIPFVQVSSSEIDFSTYTRKSRSSLLKSSNELKIITLAKDLERRVSIKKPRKSLMVINPILEIDESSMKNMEDGLGAQRIKRLSIVSMRRRSSIKEKDKNFGLQLRKLGSGSSEKSNSSLSSKNQYPSFDAISNKEITIYNYLNDSENIQGGKIEELDELEEKEDREESLKKLEKNESEM